MRSLQVGVLSVFLAVLASARAEVVERVLAVVNGHVVLLSELDTAVRLTALLNHEPIDSVTDASRRGSLDQLIDRQLLHDEMENSSLLPSTQEQVDEKVNALRRQYADAKDDLAWGAILTRYEVTEQELESEVGAEIEGLKLIDFRLRSSAMPDAAQIEHYYRTTYETEMRDRHAKPAPLAEVAPKIQEILTQRRMTDLTTTWLQTLRSQANVQFNVRLLEPAAKP